MSDPREIPEKIESGALDDLLTQIERACRNRRSEVGYLTASDQWEGTSDLRAALREVARAADEESYDEWIDALSAALDEALDLLGMDLPTLMSEDT